MNDINVNSTSIAEATREQVFLKQLAGAYELAINCSLKGSPTRGDKTLWADIHSARIKVKAGQGREHELGLAHLERPVLLRQHAEHILAEQITFYLKLQSSELSKLEEIRDGNNLEFIFYVMGHGGDGQYDNAVYSQWKFRMSKSEWAERLKQAGYMDILLLEVPMLPKDVSDDWIDIKEHLEDAQKHFVNREYRACVATCRDVIQETGQMRYGKKSWSNVLLDKLDKNARNGMNKEDRAGAIWGTLRHYTHQAHHSKSEGGEKLYTRSEAKLALILTATFVSSE